MANLTNQEKLLLTDLIQNNLQNMCGGGEVLIQDVVKNNGLVLTGVSILKNSVAPTIYIDNLIQKMRSGKITMEEIAKNVAKTYENLPDMSEGIADIVNSLTQKDIYNMVKYRVVNKEKNVKYMQESPHREFLDLIALYVVNIFLPDNSEASFIITNKIMQNYELQPTQLESAAEANSRLDFDCIEMNVLFPFLENDLSENPMIVLTNKAKCYGASVLMHSHYFKEVTDKYDDDLYILPSSRHEVITLPQKCADIHMLREMVALINSNELSEEDFLSNSVYQYCKNRGIIEIA